MLAFVTYSHPYNLRCYIASLWLIYQHDQLKMLFIEHIEILWQTSARLHPLQPTCIIFKEDQSYFRGRDHIVWNNDVILSTK